MVIEDYEIYETIIKYGGTILKTSYFQTAYRQIHHVKSTVAEHTLDVAIMAVEHALRSTADVAVKDVVEIALCHDLGILGREKKYANNAVCSQMHPKDSVQIARKILANPTERVLEGIGRHMFPITPIPPKSKEAWMVIWADKKAPLLEVLYGPVRPQIHHMVQEYVEMHARMAEHMV